MSSLFATPKVLAIGGAGIKIASRLKTTMLADFDILGIDLAASVAPFEVLSVGGDTLGVLGSGGDPEVAERAALASKEALSNKLSGANWIFIIAGLGGGTASALAPLVAEVAAKQGALVMAFVTMPFSVEGSRRTSQAREALTRLRAAVPMVAPLPNEWLLKSAPNANTQNMDAGDLIIGRAIRSLTGMICAPGLLEVDFANFKKLLGGKSGKALFAMGEGTGAQATSMALSEVTSFPLLHSGDMARHADHLIISIKASSEVGLKEVQDLATQLAEKFGVRGEKIIGATIDPTFTQRVEVVAMGLQDPEARKRQVAAQAEIKAKAPKAEKKPAAPSNQIEMIFGNLNDHRGLFEESEPNLYHGEDLDQPTYLRRGIKLMS